MILVNMKCSPHMFCLLEKWGAWIRPFESDQMIQIFVKLSFVADNLLVLCTSLLLQSSDFKSQKFYIWLFRRQQKLLRDPKCVYLRCVSPLPSAGWFSSGKVVGRNISRFHLAEKRFSRLRKGFSQLRRFCCLRGFSTHADEIKPLKGNNHFKMFLLVMFKFVRT